MKLSGVLSVVLYSVLTMILSVGVVWAVYDPSTGKWLSRDPIGELGCVNLTQAFGNDAVNNVDPWGLLNREQVDWLAQQWVKNWPGIDPASRQDVADAMAVIREELRKLSPNAFPGDVWRKGYVDDIALQKLLDAGNAMLKGFPGKAYEKCWECKTIQQYINDARKIHDIPGMSDALLISWVMKESSWVPTGSEYGWSGGKRSGTGLTMVIRTTWEDPSYQKGLPQELAGGWQQVVIDPTTSIAAGMWVLTGKKKGASLDAKLAAYKGGGTDGRNYVQKIREGEKLVNSLLGGKTFDQLSSAECQALMLKLDKLVH